MGAYFASRFFDADGFSALFLARDRRLERLQDQGLLINGTHYAIPAVHPEEIQSPADLVIVNEIPEDMIRMLWWKFMINVGMNQASAVMRAPYGLFQTSADLRSHSGESDHAAPDPGPGAEGTLRTTFFAPYCLLRGKNCLGFKRICF